MQRDLMAVKEEGAGEGGGGTFDVSLLACAGLGQRVRLGLVGDPRAGLGCFCWEEPAAIPRRLPLRCGVVGAERRSHLVASALGMRRCWSAAGTPRRCCDATVHLAPCRSPSAAPQRRTGAAAVPPLAEGWGLWWAVSYAGEHPPPVRHPCTWHPVKFRARKSGPQKQRHSCSCHCLS